MAIAKIKKQTSVLNQLFSKAGSMSTRLGLKKGLICFSTCLVFISLIGTSALITSAPLYALESVNLLARKGNVQLHRQENEKAIHSLSEALSVTSLAPYTKASILNDRGLAYGRVKKYERALNDFNHSIETFPEYATAYNNRGLLLTQMGFYKEAIKDFNTAIALQPKSGATFHNRGNALRLAGSETPAFKDYGKALGLLNNKAAPHLARGQIHWSHFRHYAALRELNLALSQDYNQSEAFYNRALVNLSLDKTKQAINDFLKAIELSPSNEKYKVTLSKVYLETGQNNHAHRLLTQILEKSPLHKQALILRGRARGAKGDATGAIEDLDQAVFVTDSAAAYAERALVHANSDMSDLAAKDMDIAIQRAPKTARTWVALGLAAQQGELVGNAERYFLEAIKYEKNNKVAKKGLKELGLAQPDQNLISLDEENDDWTVREYAKGKYMALHPRYPDLKVHLDLYGPNKPKVLEWTILTKKYKGLGLLRYDAGSKDADNPFEQVSIINLKKQTVLSIEPYRWGKQIAKWEWKEHDLVVKDAEGIENTIALYKAPAVRRHRPKSVAQKDWAWGENGFWATKPKTKRARVKRRHKVRRRSKKKKSIFGIFGF